MLGEKVFNVLTPLDFFHSKLDKAILYKPQFMQRVLLPAKEIVMLKHTKTFYTKILNFPESNWINYSEIILSSKSLD